MAMDREKALERIKKLINHAGGDGERYSDVEVETYMKHARKLMEEFNITEHELLGKGDVDATEAAYQSIKRERVYSRANRLDEFMVSIGRAVSTLTDTRLVVNTYYENGKRQAIVFIGLPLDIEIAKQMYAELLTMGRVMCKMRYGCARPREYQPYMEGFGNILEYRAREMRNASTYAQTTAIVLAKDKIVDRWIAENVTFKNSKGGGPRVDRSTRPGYGKGLVDGHRVDLELNNKVPNTERLTTNG